MKHKKTAIQRYIILAIGFMTCLILLSGCPKTTETDYDEARINAILYDIESAFIDHNIDALMQPFHNNYLHSGMAIWQVRELWLDRMSQYQLLNLQNISIEVVDDKATVSFTMKLQSSTETVYTEEPATHGDLSFFYNNGSDWCVYGNRLLYLP